MSEMKLTTHDVAPAVADRIRRRAHAILSEERRLAERPGLRALARAWNTFLEPALATGAVAIYLLWLAQTLAMIL